jgi:hypothetical protein
MKSTLLILQYIVINYLRSDAILPVALFADYCILRSILVSLANREMVAAYVGILLRVVNVSDMARLCRRVDGSVLKAISDSSSFETNHFSLSVDSVSKRNDNARFFLIIGLISIVDDRMKKAQNSYGNDSSAF